jgi:hypothetical protein
MADADQRYYSVTSACDLFKNLINGKTVTIAEVTTKGSGSTTTTYLVENKGSVQASNEYTSGDSITSDTYSSGNITNVAAWKYYWTKKDPDDPKINDSESDSPYVITITGKSDISGASCTANEVIAENGDIIITVYKDKNNIVIVNKIDLENKLNLNKISNYIEMSVKDDIGINELRNKIKEIFNLEQIEQNDYTYLSSARSISLLKKSLESLNSVRSGIKNNMPVDIVEIDLKQMWSTLGEIIGETYSDELIDQLFSQFCLGK